MRIMGRPRALFAVLTTGLVLAGCGSGPSQVDSAAIVGDRSVPLESVQQEINWLLQNSPDAQQAQQQRKLDLNARVVVDGRILHELLAVAAQREGLRVDPVQVNELIERSGGAAAIAPRVNTSVERVPEFVSDFLMTQELGAKYASSLSVDVVGTVITEESPGSTAKDQALALAKKIAEQPARAGEVISESNLRVLQQPLNLAATQGEQGGAEALPGSALFGAKPGTVVVVQPSQQQAGWFVALVKDRTTTSAAPQTPIAPDSEAVYQLGKRLLQPIAEELGIKVNPRYGVWDAASMAVLPNPDEATGYQFPVKAVQPLRP
ncbi:SurA N-terminal domain-containing protein [Saccharothrix sp. AJ9571]|nr:SurA N-terminal domain-containing protein [Saccharothrix sp. AJ9571]